MCLGHLKQYGALWNDKNEVECVLTVRIQCKEKRMCIKV